MSKYIPIGGLVAVGFDVTSSYLLTVTHSGRGVFSTNNWERIARDTALAYPEHGQAMGIGPLTDQIIQVTELDSDNPREVVSPDGRIKLRCESSAIEVVAP